MLILLLWLAEKEVLPTGTSNRGYFLGWGSLRAMVKQTTVFKFMKGLTRGCFICVFSGSVFYGLSYLWLSLRLLALD